MQTTLLALTIWCYSYYPTQPVARGRHASRRVSLRTRFCATLLVTVALLRVRADCRYAKPGRHRGSEHRVQHTVSTSAAARASDARGHDPAFWHRQRIKSRTSRSRMGAHG